LRLSLFFAENVLVEAVGEGLRKLGDIKGTQGGSSIDVIRTLSLSVHCHQWSSLFQNFVKKLWVHQFALQQQGRSLSTGALLHFRFYEEFV